LLLVDVRVQNSNIETQARQQFPATRRLLRKVDKSALAGLLRAHAR
jgi:hypothetical protein